MSKVSKLKKLGIMLIVSGMLMSMLTACGGSKTAAADDTKDNNTTAQTDAQDQTDPDENYETGDASLDDPLNQDEIGDTELLVVSSAPAITTAAVRPSAPSRRRCRRRSRITRYAAASPARSSSTM